MLWIYLGIALVAAAVFAAGLISEFHVGDEGPSWFVAVVAASLILGLLWPIWAVALIVLVVMVIGYAGWHRLTTPKHLRRQPGQPTSFSGNI